MSDAFCQKCGKLRPWVGFPKDEHGECSCRIFKVTDEYGEEWEARGRDVDEAAEKFAEEYDSNGDHAILEDSDGIKFFIIDPDNGKMTTVRIFGEMVAEYRVEEL